MGRAVTREQAQVARFQHRERERLQERIAELEGRTLTADQLRIVDEILVDYAVREPIAGTGPDVDAIRQRIASALEGTGEGEATDRACGTPLNYERTQFCVQPKGHGGPCKLA